MLPNRTAQRRSYSQTRTVSTILNSAYEYRKSRELYKLDAIAQQRKAPTHYGSPDRRKLNANCE